MSTELGGLPGLEDAVNEKNTKIAPNQPLFLTTLYQSSQVTYAHEDMIKSSVKCSIIFVSASIYATLS